MINIVSGFPNHNLTRWALGHVFKRHWNHFVQLESEFVEKFYCVSIEAKRTTVLAMIVSHYHHINMSCTRCQSDNYYYLLRHVKASDGQCLCSETGCSRRRKTRSNSYLGIQPR